MKCFCCGEPAGLETTVAYQGGSTSGWHCYNCASKAKKRLDDIVCKGSYGSIKKANVSTNLAISNKCAYGKCERSVHHIKNHDEKFKYCINHLCEVGLCPNLREIPSMRCDWHNQK